MMKKLLVDKFHDAVGSQDAKNVELNKLAEQD